MVEVVGARVPGSYNSLSEYESCCRIAIIVTVITVCAGTFIPSSYLHAFFPPGFGWIAKLKLPLTPSWYLTSAPGAAPPSFNPSTISSTLAKKAGLIANNYLWKRYNFLRSIHLEMLLVNCDDTRQLLGFSIHCFSVDLVAGSVCC